MERLNITVISSAPKRPTFTVKGCLNVLIPNSHIFLLQVLLLKNRGVMTAVKDTVAFTLHSETADSQGHYHILVCDINSITYTVVHVYAPNKHQLRFLDQILLKKLDGCSMAFFWSAETLISLLTPKWTPRPLHTDATTHFNKHCMLKNSMTNHRVYRRLDLTDKWLMPKITTSKINDNDILGRIMPRCHFQLTIRQALILASFDNPIRDCSRLISPKTVCRKS